MIVLTVAAASSGCGGGSSSEASDLKPSETFLVKGGENKIPKFGDEAGAREKEAASDVLEENLEAREAGDWETQCASLSSGGMKRVAELAANTPSPQPTGQGCVKELEELGEPKSGSRSLRKNTMTGPIDALMVKGNRAWALYHGDGGKDHAMKMEKEGGEWKIGGLTTTRIE